jgi:hypothetical protein
MTIENWVTLSRGIEGSGESLVISVPAESSACRVLCCAVQGAAAALGGRGVGERARQAVSAACALVLGDDSVGGRLTVRMTADAERVTAEVMSDLPRPPSHDELDARLAERLLSGFAERWSIEPALLGGVGPAHRVWLQVRQALP